ncbi:MAG: insulinase family protein, partial [Pyrinomonadaceae bacterium]
MSDTFNLQPLDIEEFTLDNGLRVVLNQDGAVPVVAVAVYYDVGSRNEREGRTGFAHLFEHMMFQGSANVKKAEHFQYIMKAGGTMNGTTSSERTNYFETLPASQLPLALWLESDRMRSLAVNQENLDNQREAVKEEK